MEKKTTEFKLPLLKRTSKEVDKALSKTNIELKRSARQRPASSNKVEELQQKLFSKLDSYDTKKPSLKRIAKSIKQIEMQSSTGTESTPEGFEKMQKMMPVLYNKFMEAKKDNYSASILSKKVQTTLQGEIDKQKGQEKNVQEKKGQRQQSFPTEPQPFQVKQQQGEQYGLSEEQMNSIFKQYLLNQGLAPQSTSQDLLQLNEDIMLCSQQIQKLKLSMADKIRQLAIQQLDYLQESDEQK